MGNKNEEIQGESLQVRLTPRMKTALKQYKERYGHTNYSEAVRELIREPLKKEGIFEELRKQNQEK